MYVEQYKRPTYAEDKLQVALKDDMILVSGSSHPELAHDVAQQLGIQLTEIGVSYFSNTETRVKPTADPACTFRGKRAFVLQTGGAITDPVYTRAMAACRELVASVVTPCEDDYPLSHVTLGLARDARELLEMMPQESFTTKVNDHVMEMGLIMDALRRGGCKEIVLLIPCYPYARQDKKDTSRAPISARFVADLLNIHRPDRIVCFDLHNPGIQGFFKSNCFDNLFATKVMREWMMNNVFMSTVIGDKSYTQKYILIAPDAGALPKVEKVAGYFGLDVLPMNKSRDYEKKNTVKTIQLSVSPDVLKGRSPGELLRGRTPIIVDDMADTCGTVVAAINKLIEYGSDPCIVVVTHGVLSGKAIENINGCDGLKMVLVSDTLPQKVNQARCNKIRVYSIAPMLAEIIRRTLMDKSYASLMEP